ncbi:phytoene synthase [Paraburkholderia sartisoli]|uniref:Phytoene synthase n=1 Tax=Paraburkholderia sartisoli TaxID=83784 RepID=A0A1H4E2C8_9BURK|nr:squalene/phytoene synthase family protein [Paraburkholderia sartisoli]SEA79181.1 phytoene synthase [Paraburkholderia sartisoli]
MLQFSACRTARCAPPASDPHTPIPVNFDDYCQQKAAPPGSSAYYALRQASIARQPLLTALFALRREFEETVKETSDPTIGRTKLAWWQKEMAALVEGTPSHPVSKALTAWLGDIEDSYPALQALLAGYEMDLDQARYLDYPNLQRYMAGVGGTFATLVAHATARNPAQASNWAPALGQALMLAQFVEALGDDARHGRIYIPIDEMQRFNVTAADLINRRYSDAFTELMRFQTTRARDALNAALAAIPADERPTQRTLRAQAALSLAVLDEIEREGYQVLHQRIALTPVRKLWIAWRAARKSN